jgi:hypothetical protein
MYLAAVLLYFKHTSTDTQPTKCAVIGGYSTIWRPNFVMDCSLRPPHIYTFTCTPTDTHTYTRARVHVRTYTYSHEHATQKHTHTHTHAHACSHTHTHLPNLFVGHAWFAYIDGALQRFGWGLSQLLNFRRDVACVSVSEEYVSSKLSLRSRIHANVVSSRQAHAGTHEFARSSLGSGVAFSCEVSHKESIIQWFMHTECIVHMYSSQYIYIVHMYSQQYK